MFDVNVSSDAKRHIQLFGYCFDIAPEYFIMLSGGLYLTKDGYKVGVSIIDSDDTVLDSISNPSLKELIRLNKKYNIDLFPALFVSACTQCYWNDEVVIKLRSKPMLLGLKSYNEFVSYFSNMARKMSYKEIYNFINDLADRTKNYI